jgi:hypothetical protein
MQPEGKAAAIFYEIKGTKPMKKKKKPMTKNPGTCDKLMYEESRRV